MLVLFQLKKTIQLMTCFFSNTQQNNTSLSLYSSNHPPRMGAWKLDTTYVLEVMNDTPRSSFKNMTAGKHKFWLSYSVIDVIAFFELPNEVDVGVNDSRVNMLTMMNSTMRCYKVYLGTYLNSGSQWLVKFDRVPLIKMNKLFTNRLTVSYCYHRCTICTNLC